jgi:hypothetical protein
MRRETLLFLFFIGLLLFNGPFLVIFEHNLASFLFISWIVFIGCVFLASFRSEREDGGS